MVNLKKIYEEILEPKLFLLFYIIVFFALFMTIFNFIGLNISFNLFLLMTIPAYVAFRAIDNYSTLKVAKENDEDFHKFRLEGFIAEASPFLPKLPSIKEFTFVKILKRELLLFFLIFIALYVINISLSSFLQLIYRYFISFDFTYYIQK